MSQTVYGCPNCGGIMEFNIATQGLKCPNCGTEEAIHDEKNVREHNLYSGLTKMSGDVNTTSNTVTILDCKSCGASIEVANNSTATTCPYCGSHVVLADKQVESIIPDGIRPFQIDKNRVGEIFRNWMKKRWLAPNALQTLYQQDKIMGVYLPYWTFDAQTDAQYTAEVGDDYQETYTDSDGKTQTQTKTNWSFTSGKISNFFNDVLVRASKTLADSLIYALGGFSADTETLKSYSSAYLSGFAAERYVVPLVEAAEEAKEMMYDSLVGLVESQERRFHDHVRNVRMDVDYSSETYKHVILPVYSTAYYYKGKTYNVLINGETGKINGEYPYSPVKIALIVLAVIILLAVVYYFYSRSA